MSEIYEIKHVSGPKEWQGQHGPMLSYKLDLDNNGVLERQVELNRKPESRAPEVGELLALNLEEGQYGTKAKIDFEATKELTQPILSGTATAGSRNVSAPTGDKDRSIALQVGLKVLEPRINAEGLFGTKADTAAEEAVRIQDFIIDAGQQASGGTKTEDTQATPNPQGSSSPSSPDAAPSNDVGASEQEIMEALDTAGVTVPAARQAIFAYMVAELPPDRIVKAVRNLTGQDLEMQGKTRKALISATETHTGKLIPQGDALDGTDDVPF